MFRRFALLVVPLFAASVVWAADVPRPESQEDIPEEEQIGVDRTFNDLDVDGDGYITREEARERESLADNFASADTDRNDQIDLSEFSAFEAKGMFVPPEHDDAPEPGAAPFDPDEQSAPEGRDF